MTSEGQPAIPLLEAGEVLLSGPWGRSRSGGAGGFDAVELGGIRVLENLRVAGRQPVSGTVRPAALARTLGPAPAVEEDAFLAPDAPALVVEYSVPEGRTAVHLDWDVPDARRWRAGAHVLAVRVGEDRTCRFVVTGDVTWATEARGSGSRPRLRVTARTGLEAGRPVRLMVSAAGTGAHGRRLPERGLRHLEAQRHRAWTAAAERAQHELHIVDPDGPLGRGLDWAAARLPPLGPADLQGAPRSHRLLRGLGAIALGRFSVAEGLLGSADHGGRSLLARWRGDLASRVADTVPETLEAILAADVGHGPVSNGPPGPPADDAGVVPDAWIRPWMAYDEGRADDAGEALRALIARGFDRTAGAWYADGGPWDDPTLTSLVPATLVFGMLGARADAHFGRVRLAPRLPGWCRDVSVSNLRVGASLLSLAYRREAAVHTFRLAQPAGRIPLNVVFEPCLPATALERVLVDGQPADLDRFRFGERASVRIQLPVDRERRIVIVGAD